MKHILFGFIPVLTLGAGVVLMCLVQAGAAAEREIEMMERSRK